MKTVSKTLYILLYGKALVSKKGILLKDPKAEQIWAQEGFALRGKSASKWLAYYMAMRATVMDRWTAEKMAEYPDAVVVHMGCGMDSRCLRVGDGRPWYDLDFPEVIRERRRYYRESESYHMISGDLREGTWKERLPAGGTAIVVMEGISMYLTPEQLKTLLTALKGHFSRMYLLMDCYSSFAARASKYKNPINEVGVTQVYGMDNPQNLADQTGLIYRKEWDMTPTTLIRELTTGERIVFSNLYAGKLARSLYRLFEFSA